MEKPKRWWERPARKRGYTAEEIERMGEMMTKKEQQIVKEAATIIARELAAGHEVRIQNFGVFKLAKIEVSLDHPMDPDGMFAFTHLQGRVGFKAFSALKEATKNRVERCRAAKPKACYHRQGKDRQGPCVDNWGRELPRTQ